MAKTLTLLIAIFLLLLNSACTPKSSLKLEAQIDYKIGGPQPVARTKFHLLNSELTAISKAARERGDANKDALESVRDLVMLQLEMPSIQSASTVAYDIEKAMPLLQPHLVQTKETDFKGIATFLDLTPGDYTLVGVTETRSAYAFWSYKTTVKAGENVVLLSDNNAEYAK